jgi:hypothetical protein
MPDFVVSQMPYKETYAALQKEDNDALKGLLSSFVTVSMINAYQNFEDI